jgi:hypothetical protein
VTVQVNDFRKVHDTAVRTTKIDNTMGYNVLFFLDYCIEKRDASRMSVSFSCSTKEFQEGISWGTAKIIASIQTLSFPRRMPLIGTMGVILLSDTDLEDFQADPRELDLVLTPEALKRLRQSNQRGEIENRTVPKDDEHEIVTAKTIMGESYEKEEVSSVMERMKEIGKMKDRQANASIINAQKLRDIERERISSPELPMNSPSSDISEQTEEIPSKQEVKFPQDNIQPEDSMSQMGDSQSEIDTMLRNATTKKAARFLD